jgi:hypothetical protein
MDLHGQIMNLPATGALLDWANTREAYLYGHRDARHSAAELALVADSENAKLREIVGVLTAENERLRVMLTAAQATASREIDQMAADAIHKARAK